MTDTVIQLSIRSGLIKGGAQLGSAEAVQESRLLDPAAVNVCFRTVDVQYGRPYYARKSGLPGHSLFGYGTALRLGGSSKGR
jgi:hypothetical protein